MIDLAAPVPRTAFFCLASLLLSACPSSHRTRPPRAPASTVRVGECADPRRDGTLSSDPDLQRADRDLDGDGIDEVVVADRRLCREGNCQWNLFTVARGDRRCHRYLGTVAGAALEVGEVGEAGYPELRGWWKFDEQRALLQVYQYSGAGYRLVETLLCRQGGGDGVQCVSER